MEYTFSYTVDAVQWDKSPAVLLEISELVGEDRVNYQNGILQVFQADKYWETVEPSWWVWVSENGDPVVTGAAFFAAHATPKPAAQSGE